MPVSVLPRLCTAPFAAGVLTAFPEDKPGLGLVWVAPRLFPDVPWFIAFDVLDPGDPPVPLIVLPLEGVLPAVEPEPPDPAELEAPELLLCARANE
jgi:hypothetical protein